MNKIPSLFLNDGGKTIYMPSGKFVSTSVMETKGEKVFFFFPSGDFEEIVSNIFEYSLWNSVDKL